MILYLLSNIKKQLITIGDGLIVWMNFWSRAGSLGCFVRGGGSCSLLRFLTGLHLSLPGMKLHRRRRRARVRRRVRGGVVRRVIRDLYTAVLLILSRSVCVLLRLLYGCAGLRDGSRARGLRRTGFTSVRPGRLRRRRVMPRLLRRRII